MIKWDFNKSSLVKMIIYVVIRFLSHDCDHTDKTATIPVRQPVKNVTRMKLLVFIFRPDPSFVTAFIHTGGINFCWVDNCLSPTELTALPGLPEKPTKDGVLSCRSRSPVYLFVKADGPLCCFQTLVFSQVQLESLCRSYKQTNSRVWPLKTKHNSLIASESMFTC